MKQNYDFWNIKWKKFIEEKQKEENKLEFLIIFSEETQSFLSSISWNRVIKQGKHFTVTGTTYDMYAIEVLFVGKNVRFKIGISEDEVLLDGEPAHVKKNEQGMLDERIVLIMNKSEKKLFQKYLGEFNVKQLIDELWEEDEDAEYLSFIVNKNRYSQNRK